MNLSSLFLKAYRYWKSRGSSAFLRAVLRKVKEVSGTSCSHETLGPQEIERVLSNRFPQLEPLKVFSVLGTGPRINLVTDSVNAGSLYGGVGTGILLAHLLSEELESPLRIITRTEAPEKRFFFDLLSSNCFPVHKNVEFVFAPPYGNSYIDVNDHDVFLTTSWWTTECTMRATGSRRIVYLLQEDERMFYPFGDDHNLCTNVLSNDEIFFVVNTHLLFEHFRDEGFDNIGELGIAFEPALPSSLFFYNQRRTGAKKKFMFYARPENPRNLFFLGLEVIHSAIERGILDLETWDIVLVGKDIPDLRIDPRYEPARSENLRWSEYAALVREVDLGLSLMYSPHPSYPPLDLAASGAVVVTNTFGRKQSLEAYSPNVLCAALTTEALTARLEGGVQLALNERLRFENYQHSNFNRDWGVALQEAIQSIVARMG